MEVSQSLLTTKLTIFQQSKIAAYSRYKKVSTQTFFQDCWHLPQKKFASFNNAYKLFQQSSVACLSLLLQQPGGAASLEYKYIA